MRRRFAGCSSLHLSRRAVACTCGVCVGVLVSLGQHNQITTLSSSTANLKWVSIYWLSLRGAQGRRPNYPKAQQQTATAVAATQVQAVAVVYGEGAASYEYVPRRKASRMMVGALLSFCFAVGALLLWLMNTYDGDQEQQEQPGGSKGGRKRNRRKGEPGGTNVPVCSCNNREH